ncbi:zinc finger E-box-binding homeobox 1-like, partial [Carassius auratus]|uniref:Zinc finger E-box-binding homeobox 1-like n=1 Tax=Carassius auratus TaxID=7957 RepID=A0A6P6N5L8_CARAU
MDGAPHFDTVVQLRKVSRLQQHNGVVSSYHLDDAQGEMSPVCWSPGEHESPEGKDGVQASLREHVKFCQDRDGGDSVCPLCGYSTPHRAQMEHHLTLHSQTHQKSPMSESGSENRKFKCNQCGKAFKYKHHLKEHLRHSQRNRDQNIPATDSSRNSTPHAKVDDVKYLCFSAGEKPYECSSCKKRFSHSGSYSSHLSSKKCLSGGTLETELIITGTSSRRPHRPCCQPEEQQPREEISVRAAGSVPAGVVCSRPEPVVGPGGGSGAQGG